MASPRAAGLLAAVERRAGITPAGLTVAGLAVPGFVLGRVLGSRPIFLLVYGALAVLGLSRLFGRR